MSSNTREAEKRMGELFQGLNRIEQLALLGRLEITGASIYRAFAKEEKNVKAREALLEAAKDEEKNGNLLRLMTTPKESCEKCGKAMPVASDGASCSFQCTFCSDAQASLNRRVRTAAARSNHASECNQLPDDFSVPAALVSRRPRSFASVAYPSFLFQQHLECRAMVAHDSDRIEHPCEPQDRHHEPVLALDQ